MPGPSFATAAKPGEIIDLFLRRDGEGSRAVDGQTIHFDIRGSGSLLKTGVPFCLDGGLIVGAGLVGHAAGQLDVQLILRNLCTVIQLEGYLFNVIFTLVDTIDDSFRHGNPQRLGFAIGLDLIVRLAVSTRLIVTMVPTQTGRNTIRMTVRILGAMPVISL